VKSDIPDQLRLVALIGRTGTLTGAAAILGITPAAATQRLSRTEQDWGTTLVLRGPRGATLTVAGALLARYGDLVEQQVQDAQAAFDAMRGQASRRLRIGTFQAAALHLLPPALTALRHRHPDADLSIVDIPSDQAVQAVASGDLDLAVLATYGTPPQTHAAVTTYHLLRDPLVVALPDDHRLAQPASRPLRLQQLRDETWVLIRAGHVARAQFDRAAQAVGFEPHVRFETESYDVAQALVGTGIGVALVSRLALNHAPGTTHRPLQAPALHRDIHVAVPADTSLIPLANTFMDLLRDVCREITNG
jgi:DNA-binding transcriptional LysR family regulator